MTPAKPHPQKALLIVDVQNDFCPGGALAVPAGDQVIAPLNRYIKFFSQKKLPIFASRDWHPRQSVHFKRFGGNWPVHCVQDTRGARFHPGLKLPKGAFVLFKGMDPAKDSYSAFDGFDNHRRAFINLLRNLGIEELYIGGLATDYCVKSSALDALKNGFAVRLLVDAIKGVEIKRGDVRRAIQEMLSQGAKGTTLQMLNIYDRPAAKKKFAGPKKARR